MDKNRILTRLLVVSLLLVNLLSLLMMIECVIWHGYLTGRWGLVYNETLHIFIPDSWG